MEIFYKPCLLAGSALALLPFNALAEDEHKDHDVIIGNTAQSHTNHHHEGPIAPITVMGDHTHDKGKWMVSY